MSYSIQAEMKKRVDDLGTTLLEKIIPYQSKERNKHFRTRRPITHTIDQQQMSGPMIGGDVDASGRTYDRHYLEGDLAYSLPDEDSDDLYRASDQLLKIRWVREGFARSSIEDEVFKWSCITHRAETRQSLSEYIIDLALKNIKKTTVYVPINFLEAEEDFTFGELRFKTLTAEFLSELFVKMEAITPGKHTDSLKAMHSEMCSKTQGLVAVVVELEAESEFAHKRAHAIASVAVSLFRFFSGASVSPWLTCHVQLWDRNL